MAVIWERLLATVDVGCNTGPFGPKTLQDVQPMGGEKATPPRQAFPALAVDLKRCGVANAAEENSLVRHAALQRHWPALAVRRWINRPDEAPADGRPPPSRPVDGSCPRAWLTAL